MGLIWNITWYFGILQLGLTWDVKGPKEVLIRTLISIQLMAFWQTWTSYKKSLKISHRLATECNLENIQRFFLIILNSFIYFLWIFWLLCLLSEKATNSDKIQTFFPVYVVHHMCTYLHHIRSCCNRCGGVCVVFFFSIYFINPKKM